MNELNPGPVQEHRMRLTTGLSPQPYRFLFCLDWILLCCFAQAGLKFLGRSDTQVSAAQ